MMKTIDDVARELTERKRGLRQQVQSALNQVEVARAKEQECDEILTAVELAIHKRDQALPKAADV